MVDQSPHSVLVCSPRSFRDSLAAWPALTALQAAAPTTRFRWLAHPDVSSFGTTAKHLTVHSTPPTVWSALRCSPDLRHRDGDLFIDARRDLVSKILGKRLGVPRLALTPALAWEGELVVDSGLCRRLSIRQTLPLPSVAVPAESQHAVDQFIQKSHLTCGFVAAHASPKSTLPPRECGRILRQLGRSWRIPSLLLYRGRDQLRWAVAAASRSGGHALIAPRWDWPQLAAAVARAELFLVQDRHFAAVAALTETEVLAPSIREGSDVDFVLAACDRSLAARPNAVHLARAA